MFPYNICFDNLCQWHGYTCTILLINLSVTRTFQDQLRRQLNIVIRCFQIGWRNRLDKHNSNGSIRRIWFRNQPRGWWGIRVAGDYSTYGYGTASTTPTSTSLREWRHCWNQCYSVIRDMSNRSRGSQLWSWWVLFQRETIATLNLHCWSHLVQQKHAVQNWSHWTFKLWYILIIIITNLCRSSCVSFWLYLTLYKLRTSY